jgi:hypothetical protein
VLPVSGAATRKAELATDRETGPPRHCARPSPYGSLRASAVKAAPRAPSGASCARVQGRVQLADPGQARAMASLPRARTHYARCDEEPGVRTGAALLRSVPRSGSDPVQVILCAWAETAGDSQAPQRRGTRTRLASLLGTG